MTKASTLPQHHKNSVRARDYFLPAAIALACASAAYAGADTTFDPALQKFTYNACSLYVLMRFG